MIVFAGLLRWKFNLNWKNGIWSHLVSRGQWYAILLLIVSSSSSPFALSTIQLICNICFIRNSFILFILLEVSKSVALMCLPWSFLSPMLLSIYCETSLGNYHAYALWQILSKWFILFTEKREKKNLSLLQRGGAHIQQIVFKRMCFVCGMSKKNSIG